MNTDAISSIISTRALAAGIVEKSVSEKFVGISELDFKKSVKNNFENNPDIFSEGWYNPPPDGIAVLFAPEEKRERLKFDTLRNPIYWPQVDNIMSDDSLASIYVSPIQKNTGIIGDLGITLYNGKNLKLQKYLKDCLNTQEEIVTMIEFGMPFRDIYTEALKIMNLNGYQPQEWVSAGAISAAHMMNIGHTIPASYESYAPEEMEIIKHGLQEQVNSLISRKRIFIDSEQNFRVKDTGAFTIEPRFASLEDPSLPIIYFHMMIIFENGQKKVCSNFNPLFKAVGMDKYLSCKFG